MLIVWRVFFCLDNVSLCWCICSQNGCAKWLYVLLKGFFITTSSTNHDKPPWFVVSNLDLNYTSSIGVDIASMTSRPPSSTTTATMTTIINTTSRTTIATTTTINNLRHRRLHSLLPLPSQPLLPHQHQILIEYLTSFREKIKCLIYLCSDKFQHVHLWSELNPLSDTSFELYTWSCSHWR